MISMEEFFKAVNYKITEGGDYGWECYGPYSHRLSAWNGKHGEGGWSADIIFSTKSQKVYEVTVCDYTNNRAYRMINPKFVDKHNKEADRRSLSADQVWDDVNYIDLEVDADFLDKTQAIVTGRDYDTRVQIEVDFTDQELLEYMKIAHKRDITFNALIEESLRHVIKEHGMKV